MARFQGPASEAPRRLWPTLGLNEMDASRMNSIASSLLWLWGALVLLAGFAVGYPALMTQGTPVFLVAFAVWGTATCLAAFALRKRRWGVRWWASALCLLSALTMLLMNVKLSLLGVALNILALVLIVISWRFQLQPGAPGDGPRPAGSARA